ncbi:MAG: DUF2141 domain-containing protein [Candidatus Moduliflexus flocculans]|nr:DUF2141 domain-containing protein [Candidatus Moduliflexus flocculans]
MLATEANQAGTITVQLTGFENNQGTVKLCVCRSEDEYTGKAKEFCTASTEIKSTKAEWVFENTPYGSYSIKAFHDENGNSRLDKNFLGVPTERVRVLEQCAGTVWATAFSRAAVTLNSPQIKIEIEAK